MKALSYGLNYILPVMYLVVVVIYFYIFFRKRKDLESKTSYVLLGLILLHALEISIRHVAIRAMPLSTAFDALSFLGFSILLVYFIIELSVKNRSTGLFILSFAFITVLISSFNHQWKMETNPLLNTPAFAFHASLTLVGHTALALSAIYALLYIMQNRNMKYRRFGVIYEQLPALTHLEMMSIRSVAIGIILLGAGIVLGHIQANKLLGSFWLMDPKVIISDIIWLIYAVSYVLARVLKWRGRFMAYLAVTGFLILLSGSLITILLAESFHKFY